MQELKAVYSSFGKVNLHPRISDEKENHENDQYFNVKVMDALEKYGILACNNKFENVGFDIFYATISFPKSIFIDDVKKKP